MPIDLSGTGIDPERDEFQPMLNHLQYNILKAHGREFTAHLFLRFKGSKTRARTWIQDFASRVTSARRQFDQIKERNASKGRGKETPGELNVNFFLTASGYKSLEFDPNRFRDEDRTFRR